MRVLIFIYAYDERCDLLWSHLFFLLFVVNTPRAPSAAGKAKIYNTNIIKFFNYANFLFNYFSKKKMKKVRDLFHDFKIKTILVL